MSNPVVQWQIVTKNPEELAAFYSSLFGWSVNANNAMGYREMSSGNGRGISGGIWPRGDEGQNLVQLFVEVEDIDAVLEKATQLGGRTLMPQQQLPDGDAMALMLDPAGLSLGLVTPKKR